MAEPYLANIVGQFQQGLAFGGEQRRQQEAEQRQSRLSELASLAYGAQNPDERRSLVGQAVAVDPSAGLALGGSLAKDDENQQMELVKAIRLVGMYPEAQQPEAYRRVVGQLRQRFPGLPIPDEIDDNARKALTAINAAYGSAEEAAPAGYRQLDLAARAAGFEPGTPEYQNYFQVQGGIKGRAPTGGFNFELVPGVGYVRENPRAGTLELYDPQTRSIVPIVGGADINADAGVPQPPASPPAQGGVVVTNEQGERGRYSIGQDGRPVFISESVPANVAQGITADPAAFQGQDQVTLPPQFAGGQAPAPSPAVQRFGEITTRTPEQQAFLTEQEKERARLDAYDRATALEAEREGAKTAARETAEVQTQKALTLPQTIATADQTIGVIDSLINHPGREAATGLSALADPRNLIPGTDAYDFRVALDRLKGQAFLQAFQSLRGGGAITEREGKAATDAIAALDSAQSEGEFLKALRDLRGVVDGGKRRALQSAGRGGGTGGGPAPQRARNPQTGQVIELRNGQWVPVDG